MSAASIALLAGAQRSSTVVDRFLAAAPKYDLLVSTPGLDRADVLALPGVARADPGTYVAFGVPVAGGFQGVNGVATDFSVRNPEIRVLSGAWPATDDPTQVVVNEAYVTAFGGKPGDALNLTAFGLDQLDDVQRGVYEPHGPAYSFTIAAVVRLPRRHRCRGRPLPEGEQRLQRPRHPRRQPVVGGSPRRVPRLGRRVRRRVPRRDSGRSGIP